MRTVSSTRIWAARFVALSADFIQIVLAPFLVWGAFDPLDDVLDVVVCAILTGLVGWHYSFLPSFMLKVVPFADMVPTWTLAVLFATRGQKNQPAPPVITRVYNHGSVPPRIGPGARPNSPMD